VQVGADRFGFVPNGKMPPARELDRFRSHLGMVFQQFDLFPHMTAIENVMSGPRIVREMAEKPARELARDLLAKVGLAEKADVYPRNLSGGQQQRVAIARALAMEPQVILFDEATSALDPELVDEVLKVMAGLAKEGKTMIIVTHEMAFARDVAHRVTVMDAGLVVEEGVASELFARPQNPRTKSFLSRFHMHAGA
jgi:ABC-type polar amino acid transport system ATPase subunit